jgi:hypothetical protein
MDPIKQYKQKAIMESLKEKDENTLLLPCECGDLSHVVEFRFFQDNGSRVWEAYIQAFLNRQPNFFKRLVIAALYVFKFRNSPWYEYDSNVLNQYQIIKLRDFIDRKLKEK